VAPCKEKKGVDETTKKRRFGGLVAQGKSEGSEVTEAFLEWGTSPRKKTGGSLKKKKPNRTMPRNKNRPPGSRAHVQRIQPGHAYVFNAGYSLRQPKKKKGTPEANEKRVQWKGSKGDDQLVESGEKIKATGPEGGVLHQGWSLKKHHREFINPNGVFIRPRTGQNAPST